MFIRMIALLLFCTPLVASAAGVVTLEDRDESGVTGTTFEYLDAHTVRMSAARDEQDGYMLVRDGKVYTVSYDGDRPFVMDMADMSAFAREMSNQMGQQPQPPLASGGIASDFQSMRKTGRKETVAGIQGDIYELTWREDGKIQREEAVLSKDPRAVEFTEAVLGAFQAMGQATGTEVFDNDDNSLFARLQRERLGILRLGSDWRVVSFRSGADRSRFELPAPVISMKDLMSGMGMPAQYGGGMREEAPGNREGIMGGIYDKAGQKVERQERRVEQKADRAIDRTMDEAVDSLLKGLFK